MQPNLQRSAYNYDTRTESLFLDQMPALETLVRDWLETIDLNPQHVAFDIPKIEALECRSRDGFSRSGHNFGGFDKGWLTDVSACNGSGCGPDLKEIDRQVEQAYSEAIQWFKDQAFIGLEHLTDKEITYSNLHELGRGDLAEKLDEVEREWMSRPVWFGVRAMYEGQDSKGIHTLMIYVSGNVSECYGLCGKGSETKAEFEIHFKTASGLRRQLGRLKAKVEGSI